MAGYMDDPAPAYGAADAFVFASRNEGFGNVLIEAMAFGLPVVSRRLPGVTDHIVEHGRDGFLFDTDAEYVESVRALISDPSLRGAMGAAARETAVTRFDLGAIAAQYAGIYRKLAPGE
jgi:glycosyltransferase involved in cell wall biosynthesis